jgi:hypothetical protein
MNKRLSLPDWLPSIISDHAVLLYRSGGLNNAENLLFRLIASLEMRTVWQSLEKHAQVPEQLIDYLELVRLHSVLTLESSAPISIPSDRLQQSAFSKFNKSITQAMKALEELAPSKQVEEGWALLANAIERYQLHALQHITNQVVPAFQIQEGLDKLNETGIVNSLRLLRTASHLATLAPSQRLPKRRDSAKAKMNQLAMDLSDFCQYRFGKPFDVCVAATVSVAFEYYKGGISADDVRKLRTPLKPKRQSPSK